MSSYVQAASDFVKDHKLVIGILLLLTVFWYYFYGSAHFSLLKQQSSIPAINAPAEEVMGSTPAHEANAANA